MIEIDKMEKENNNTTNNTYYVEKEVYMFDKLLSFLIGFFAVLAIAMGVFGLYRYSVAEEVPYVIEPREIQELQETTTLEVEKETFDIATTKIEDGEIVHGTVTHYFSESGGVWSETMISSTNTDVSNIPVDETKRDVFVIKDNDGKKYYSWTKDGAIEIIKKIEGQ